MRYMIILIGCAMYSGACAQVEPGIHIGQTYQRIYQSHHGFSTDALSNYFDLQ
jgi:hypothetical protein